MVEKESNRLVLDLSSQPVNLSKLDATGIVFKIKKWVQILAFFKWKINILQHENVGGILKL